MHFNGQSHLESNNHSEQIDRLNAEAWNLRVSDSEKAFVISKQAADLAQEINYQKGIAEAFKTLGFCYIRLSKHDEAIGYLERSLSLLEQQNDLRGQSHVLEYFGIIYRSKGDYELSLKNLYKALELTRQSDYNEGQSLANYHLGVTYKYLGNFEKALDYLLESLYHSNKEDLWISMSYALNMIGVIYHENNDYSNALKYYEQSLEIRKKAGDKWGEAGNLDNMGVIFLKLQEIEKAKEYCSASLELCKSIGDKKGQANAMVHLGNIAERSAEFEKSSNYLNTALEIRREIGDKKGEAEILVALAELGITSAKNEYYREDLFNVLHNAAIIGEEIKALDLVAKIKFCYYELHKHYNEFKEALKWLEKYIEVEKELHKEAVSQKVLNLEVSHKVEEAKKEAEIIKLRNVELAGLYEKSKKQKEAIEEQKKIVDESITELKRTQRQLIHSEKMASLGELTAGIAHEIQNPLNFVNNFAEVSSEIIIELKEALKTPDNGAITELASDLDNNLKKISLHGKRADTIVKNMLMHSRKSTGQKEPVDINKLADEYLQLAYHGFRARDKNFNAALQTNFHPSPLVLDIIPPDIGRVLLNLYNNAFYSVTEKKQHLLKSMEIYEPTVWISTEEKEIEGTKLVSIHIKDNGKGISPMMLDKIYQPFFTTKPTGQGTGLGLSMSYDIITAHGGEIKVETTEGEGASFIINLPGR